MGNKKILEKKDIMDLMWDILFTNAYKEYKALGVKDDNLLIAKLNEAEKKLAAFETEFLTFRNSKGDLANG